MSALHEIDEALAAVLADGGGGERKIFRSRAEAVYSERWTDRDEVDRLRRDQAIESTIDVALDVLWSLKGWARGNLKIEVDRAEREARGDEQSKTRPVLASVDGVLDALLGTSLDDLPRPLALALADLLSFFPETAAEVEGLDS